MRVNFPGPQAIDESCSHVYFTHRVFPADGRRRGRDNGTTAQTIGGWTVQYAPATGVTWQSTLIPAGTSLPAGRYFLIKQAPGAGGTVDITPDLSGTIAMSGTNGKVALVSSATALTGAAPAAGAAVDVVSYGAATPTEVSPTAPLSNTTAAIRDAAGCTCGGDCPADPFTVSPYRSSDHGPVIIGLNLYKTFNGTTGRDTIIGTAGDDLIVGGAGADTLTGGLGRNVFFYQSMRDAGDTITDFVPGKDRIDLDQLLALIGVNKTTAFSSGVVKLVASGVNTVVQIDVDGTAGAGIARTLLTLTGVLPSQIVALRDLGVQ